MATKSILKNVEIRCKAEAEQLVNALEKAEKLNFSLDLIIDLTEGLLQEEGFKVLPFSKSRLRTTAYNGLIIKDSKGQEYTVIFDKSIEKDGRSTNFIKD